MKLSSPPGRDNTFPGISAQILAQKRNFSGTLAIRQISINPTITAIGATLLLLFSAITMAKEAYSTDAKSIIKSITTMPSPTVICHGRSGYATCRGAPNPSVPDTKRVGTIEQILRIKVAIRQ